MALQIVGPFEVNAVEDKCWEILICMDLVVSCYSIQLLESFKIDKNMHGFGECMSLLENQRSLEEIYYQNVWDKRKRLRSLWYNGQDTLEQWESLWIKRLKFKLNANLKEKFYKMMHRYYLTKVKLAKMYEKVPNRCWKYKKTRRNILVYMVDLYQS